MLNIEQQRREFQSWAEEERKRTGGIPFSPWEVWLAAKRSSMGEEPVATVIKKGINRQWMSEALGDFPDGVYSLYAAPPSTDAKDAERWRETLQHVGGTYNLDGFPKFTLRYLKPIKGANILIGGVSGHFTAAIDAAIAAKEPTP